MSFGSLLIVLADGSTRRVSIDKQTMRIGRNPDNDVVIDDPSISGYHARIFADPSGVSILDIGSRNGTEVDGQAIDTLARLTPGSLVRIGGVSLRVAGPGPAAPADDDFLLLQPFPEAQPAPTPAQPAQSGPPLVRLELLPPAAAADISLGGPALIVFEAKVQNLSRFVDRIDISVEAPAWMSVRVDPPFHNLNRGDGASSRIEIEVARAATSSAGEHQIELVARSQKRPELRFTAEATLSVSPFTEFRAELEEPRARTAWTGARYQVRATNLSNRPLSFTLDGVSPDAALNFRFDPDPIEAKPGALGQSTLRARFKLARLFGQPKSYSFGVSVAPFDGSAPAQEAGGRLIQRPPVPPWMLRFGAIMALIGLLLACASLLFRLREPVLGFLFPQTPTVNVAAVTATAFTEKQDDALTALAQSAEAVAGANAEAQTAQAAAAGQTQAALQNEAASVQAGQASAAASAQTAAAGDSQGTQTAQVSQAAASATSFAGQSAGTATAQANATGTVLAAAQTAQAQTPSAGPASATPTLGPAVTPTLAGPGQVITFERVRGVPVTVQVPIRGDEYAGQDAFFCFYQPLASGLRRSSIHPARLAQGPASVLSINDVSQNESNAGSTNFVFTVTWTFAAPVTQSQVLTVDYITSDGGPLPAGTAAATSPADYLPVGGTAVLQVVAGATQAQATIGVAVVGDTLFEPNEVFSVTLSNPSNSAISVIDGTGVGVILNDDQPATLTPTPSLTPVPSATATASSTAVAQTPAVPPSGDVFDCRPQVPRGSSLRLLQGAIFPPPVTAANNAPDHSLAANGGTNRLVSDSIAVVNFQRNIAEVDVDLWYPGGTAATYVLFAFDERGTVIASVRRDAIGVPAAYQLNVRSIERPIRQIVIEARPNFAGDFNADYSFAPIVPPLLTRVELHYTTP